MFLDHLDAGAAVLGDLINVRAFHQPKADIRVPKTVGGASIAVSILLESCSFQYSVEELDVVAWKDLVDGLRKRSGNRLPRSSGSKGFLRTRLAALGNPLGPVEKALIRFDGVGSAFAETDAPFSTYFDEK